MNLFYYLIRFVSKSYFLVFYRQKAYGLEHFIKGPALIAGNHSSFFDPPFVAATAPEEIHFLAKQPLFEIPFFGSFIRCLNAYPIAGSSRDLSSFKKIQELVSQQKKIIIFPEGGRSFDGKIGKMKSGIGMLALKMGCPIIPVYIHNADKIWKRGKRFPKFFGNTCCVYGSAIQTKDFAHLPKKEAQEAITEKVRESLQNLRRWYLDGAKGSPP